MDKRGYLYLLASGRHGTLYLGVTSNLERRLYEHREGLIDGFTKDYEIGHLVYYEVWDRIDEAIAREKRVKKWRRDWKIRLIEMDNPQWQDLAIEMGFPALRRMGSRLCGNDGKENVEE